MNNNFQTNLRKLAEKYSQKYIAEKTNFSQSSINNYLTKNSEPSIQFLIALKNAFGINVDEFLFSEIKEKQDFSLDRFVGNYLVYYYNNSSYKGEVHNNVLNTLNYGVVSIAKDKDFEKSTLSCATFVSSRSEAVALLKEVNHANSYEELLQFHKKRNNFYEGNVSINQKSLFIELSNNVSGDRTFIILNNPPSPNKYIGGIGTVNSVARGRENNPCVQFIILSKKLIDKPDGEIYNCLKLNDYSVNIDFAINDVLALFKKLYLNKDELAFELTEEQKMAIIQNKLEYHLDEILEANVFRFAKVSDKEDDSVYRLLREGIDV